MLNFNALGVKAPEGFAVVVLALVNRHFRSSAC